MSDEGRTIRRPKAWAKHDAMKLIEEWIVDFPADFTCEYMDDWSDAKIAKETGVPETTVAYLRKEKFGTLRPKRNPTQEDLFNRLEALEKRVRKLEDNGGFLDKEDDRPSWNGASHHME